MFVLTNNLNCSSVNFSLSSQCFQFSSFPVADTIQFNFQLIVITATSHIQNAPQACYVQDKTNNISVPLLCAYMLSVHVNINTTYIYHELTFTQHTWVGRISSVSWLGEIWGVWLLCTAYYDLWRPGSVFYCSRRQV